MTKQEITTSEAARTVGAFKGLLFGMRPFMALQVFQSGKGPTAGCADMRTRLISFGGRDIGIGLGVGFDLFRGISRDGCEELDNWVENCYKAIIGVPAGTSLILARSSILGLVFGSWTMESSSIA